jgi:protein-disulfide isomerase
MTSGKKARRQRQQVAAPPPVQRKGARRRASPKVLVGAALVALILAVTAVGIATALGKTSSASPTATRGSLANALPGASGVQQLLAGIPEHGNVLGSPRAPATMIEYVDLQCPFCREFEAAVMPDIFRRFVRTGKLRVEARTIAFIGQDSVRGRNAAIAAGQQGRMFNFMQIAYFNQGTENTGWLTSDFVKKAGGSIPGLDLLKFTTAASSSVVSNQGNRFDSEATAAHVAETPSVYVGRTGRTPRIVQIKSPDDEQTLVAAIRRAGG